MKLFDAHCHLQDDALFPDLGNVMLRAAAAGVEKIAVCLDFSKPLKKEDEFFQGLEKSEAIYSMIGIHPWFVGCRAGAVTPPESAIMDRGCNWRERFQRLEKLLLDFPMVGIGETGLDFQEKFTNRAEQEASFAAHLDLACELNRPIAVHCVKAWGRLIEILREHPAPRVLLHAFGGAPELIPELIELNCWFSFCGNVTNPNAKRVRASAAAVPAARLLIETDSPDFPPAGCELPNEPANLIHVARAVAELRGVSVEAFAEATFLNAIQVFGAI
ncbi:MAG: TatD family hydrolase [Kiritimatiellales bacterium]|nr:TatD family hydrolase [Kiritimatiellales bacterium]